MRRAPDLLRLPYTFTQLRPFLPNAFVREARERGVFTSEQELEILHRLRLLVPLLRLQRDGREIALAARRGEPAWARAYWQPTSRHSLVEARAE